MFATVLHALLLLLLHPFNGLFSRTACVSRHEKCKSSLDSNEARDDGVLGCSGISWTICKQYAHSSRQIATLTPIIEFLQAGCSSCRPTNIIHHIFDIKACRIHSTTSNSLRGLHVWSRAIATGWSGQHVPRTEEVGRAGAGRVT